MTRGTILAATVVAAAFLAGCGGGGGGSTTDGPQAPAGGEQTPADGGQSGSGHDFIFSGTVASEQARTDGLAAIAALVGSTEDDPNDNSGSDGYGLNLWTEGILYGRPPSTWGYWNSEGFDQTAEVYQTTRVNGALSPTTITDKQVIAVMEHGWFGIAHAVEDPVPAFGDHFGFAAAYRAGNPVSRSLESLNLAGAAYSGDALAIEKNDSATGHVGTALLIVQDKSVWQGSIGHQYTVTLSVNLENGQHFNNIGTAGCCNSTGFTAAENTFGGGRTDVDEFSGHFAGPNAEQAFGTFETPAYVGSFGVSR